MRMETLKVPNVNPGIRETSIQRDLNAARRVFNEHEILAIQRGECLLIGTLDGSL